MSHPDFVTLDHAPPIVYCSCVPCGVRVHAGCDDPLLAPEGRVEFWLLRPYQKDRILTFLNPESDPLGTGWNIIQS